MRNAGSRAGPYPNPTMNVGRFVRGGLRLAVMLAVGVALLGSVLFVSPRPANAADAPTLRMSPQATPPKTARLKATRPKVTPQKTKLPKIMGVRVGVRGTRTRIVLDMDQKLAFDFFTLPAPYRVVLNLPEVSWNLDVNALPKQKGLLTRLRYGLFAPGASRMVFDVNAPVQVKKSFIIKPVSGNRWRLVLDLTSTTETRFLETLAQQRARERKKRVALATSTPQSPRTATSRPALQRKTAHSSKHIIAIDPGHGGVDPGTIGRSGAREKNVTLALSRTLKRALEITGRYKVVMTRNRDIFLRLRDRVKVAREAGAELFISIHADSVSNHATRGLSIYTLSEKASDREAAKLAAKENKSDLIAGIDLTAESQDVTSILLDLAQRETMNQSTLLAQDLVRELRRQVRLLPNTHRFAGFAVLKAPDMPSVLVEAGFLSNRQDERNLLNRAYQRNLARAIVRGVDRHFAGVEEASAR